jgi:phage gpG-like protein
MLNIESRFEGDISKLQSLPETIKQQVGLAFSAVVMDIEARAKSNAVDSLNTTGQATGSLASSITHSELDTANLRAEIGSSKVYAAIHEFGGVIEARESPYLVFQLPDGSWRKCKSVTIPARPYLRPAMDATMGDLGDLFQQKLSVILV